VFADHCDLRKPILKPAAIATLLVIVLIPI
jgi:hypothetical protein